MNKLPTFLLLMGCGTYLIFEEIHLSYRHRNDKRRNYVRYFMNTKNQTHVQLETDADILAHVRTVTSDKYEQEDRTVSFSTSAYTSTPTNDNDKTTSLNYCPSNPPNLVGPVQLNRTNTTTAEQEKLLTQLHHVVDGGIGRPEDCRANHRVAILVPFRNRAWQLPIMLRHLHPILVRQQISYRVFVVEQTSNGPFNKGVLFNAAALEVDRRFNKYFDCFVLQDVDILPEDDRILYRCAKQPIHLSKYIDRYRYEAQFFITTGGILAIRAEVYMEINGFSNAYYGWGGEDDDLLDRIKARNYTLESYPSWAKCGSMEHGGREKENDRYEILKSSSLRQPVDGVNNVNFTISDYRELQLYTYIGVRVNIPDAGTYLEFVNKSIQSYE